MRRKIVPFVDHEIGFRLLQKLIEFSDNDEIEIPLVVTTSTNGRSWWHGVEDVCRRSNIPLVIYGPSLNPSQLRLPVDWFFLLSWKHIIPTDMIAIPSKGVLNLHYSLLPEFRGVYPVNWAIIEGACKTGVTYHLVNEQIDCGIVLLQAETDVDPTDTARTLQLKLDDVAYDNFDLLMAKILPMDRIEVVDGIGSDAVAQGAAYYSRKKFNERCEIDVGATYCGSEFINLLRGLTFLEDSSNAFFYDRKTGKRIYISVQLKHE